MKRPGVRPGEVALVGLVLVLLFAVYALAWLTRAGARGL